MKLFPQTLLLACLIIISKISYSQIYSYATMPASSAIWQGLIQTRDGVNQWNAAYSEYTNGDTIINGKRYTIIFEHYLNSDSYSGYCIREDSTRKVYAIGRLPQGPTFSHPNDSIEHLLYDFSMAVGDSIVDTFLNYRVKIARIDTITTINGLRRKFWTQTGGFGNFWIEGVGGNQILANQFIDCFESCVCLSTLTVNGQLTYQDTFACPLLTDIHNLEEQILSISPNPVYTTLNIRSDKNNIIRLSVFAISGKKLLEQETENVKETSIKVTHLSIGLYLLVIEDEKGNKIIKKFTKE